MVKRLAPIRLISEAKRTALLALSVFLLQGCQLEQIAEYLHKLRAGQFIDQCGKDCNNNRYERAEKSVRIAVDEARQCPSDKELLENNLAWLGYVLHGQRRYYEAVPVFQEALELAKQAKNQNKSKIAGLIERLAECYQDEGAYDAASNSLTEAISLLESSNEKNAEDVLYDRYYLTDVQYKAGRYLACVKSCRILLDRVGAGADKKILARTSEQLGKSYEKLGQKQEAESAFLASIELAEHTPKSEFAGYLQSIGMFYERMNNNSKAKTYCERSLMLHEELILEAAKKLNGGQHLLLTSRLGPRNRKDFILSLEDAEASPDRNPDAIRNGIVRDIEAMPPKVIDVLARTGCRVVIVPQLSTTAGVFKNHQPTGWPDGMSWDAAGAAYDYNYNMVFVPRKMLARRRSEIVSNYRIDEVVRHELGHALDAYLGWYSREDAFKKPFLQDKLKLSDKQKQKFAYGLQFGDQGPAETFAELFNNLCGGACTSRTKYLYAAFPQCYAALKNTLTSKQLFEPVQSAVGSTGI
jgi:tetratricopeptide (TPR) repeat protein